jgi:hypothetical protein
MEIFIYLCFFISYGLFTLFITDGSFGSVITPAYGILIFWVISRCDFDTKHIRPLFVIMLFVFFYWVVKSFGYFNQFILNRSEYINTNTVAMLLLYLVIYSSIFSDYLNIKFSRILKFILVVLGFWGIYNMQSRGALIGLVAFSILYHLVPKRFWNNKKRVLLTVITVMIIGSIFPYIYTRLYLNGVSFTLPLINKDFYTGRELIWQNFFSAIGSSGVSVLFGLGSDAELWTGHTLNIHNNYLAVISNFGIIGFFAYYIFVISQIGSVYKNKKTISEYQANLIIGFLCVLILGAYEVSTLWFMMLFFNFLFLGLAVDHEKKQAMLMRKEHLSE